MEQNCFFTQKFWNSLMQKEKISMDRLRNILNNISISHSLFLFLHVSSPQMLQSVVVVFWRLFLQGECVCACMYVCMHVCVWPCVPLLSAVILPASGFDKDQHCGGKWINSCLHFVAVCMLRFASLCSHRWLFMTSVFMHYMCIFMFVFISVCAKF